MLPSDGGGGNGSWGGARGRAPTGRLDGRRGVA